jgi:hypothetical protein
VLALGVLLIGVVAAIVEGIRTVRRRFGRAD